MRCCLPISTWGPSDEEMIDQMLDVLAQYE